MSRARLLLVGLVLVLALLPFVPGPPSSPARAARIAAPEPSGDWANTYSIVACDPANKQWGVAVASKYLAVGSVVPFAKAGVGAVATQSFVNVSLGTKGLEIMAKGKSAEEALEEALAGDKERASRQVGMIDAKGRPATFTGKGCLAWAGGKTGKHYAVQGNILTGKEVVGAMAKAFEAHPKHPLAWRLQESLEAGEKAGGDKRGKQSAALLVVREGWGANGFGDRYIDLRVDDHETPVQELTRILAKRVRKPAKARPPKKG